MKTYGKLDVYILKALSNKHFLLPRSPALPGDADPEALPPVFLRNRRGTASRYRFPGTAGEPVPRSRALPGDADPEALPPVFLRNRRGRASRYRFPGTAGEPVKPNRYYEKYIYLSIYS